MNFRISLLSVAGILEPVTLNQSFSASPFLTNSAYLLSCEIMCLLRAMSSLILLTRLARLISSLLSSRRARMSTLSFSLPTGINLSKRRVSMSMTGAEQASCFEAS